MADNIRGDEGIQRKRVDELIRIIDNTPDGSYAFLVGAGVSRPEPAEIPLAGELVEEFKRAIYAEQDRGKPFEKWVEGYESKHKNTGQSGYAFWFSKACPNLQARQTKISELVKGTEPPLGQLILASMLQDRIVSHVFTPNFDDLLVNASIDLPGQRPLFVDHDARASRIQFPSDRPAIIKVHGDYLHYTKNTDEETATLNENIEQAFVRSLQSHGLVVIGYGGTDNSIMNVLEETDLSDKGVYWCELIDSEIDERVANLLKEEENAYLVEIAGSEEFFGKLVNRVDSVELPEPEEFEKRAKETADRIRELVSDREYVNYEYGGGVVSAGTPEESTTNSNKEEIIADLDGRVLRAWELVDEGELKEAKSVLNEVIDDGEGSAGAHFVRGEALNELSEYEAAIKDYTRTLKLWNENSEVYLQRGRAKYNLEEYEGAIEDFDHAINLDPDSERGYLYRGLAKYNLGEYEEAIEDFNHAINLDPESENGYLYRGLAKGKVGLHEATKEDLSQVIQINPENALAYKYIGVSKTILGEYETAIEDYSQAIDLDPEDAEAYYYRGNAKMNLERNEAAIEDYSQAIELDPEYPEAYFNRGFAKTDLEQYEAAIEDYSQAIELDPEYPEAYFNRGNAKASLKRYEAAIEDYSQAIDLDAESAEAYVNRGNAKASLERNEAAIEDYSQAIDLDPEDAETYFNRGFARANLERNEAAIEDYSQAIELDPEYAEAYVNRGNAKASLERNEAAIEDYSQAIDYDPEYAEAYFNRGNAKVGLEQYEAAIEDYSQAIDYDPEYAEAYVNRGSAKADLEQYEAAIEDYSQAIDLDPEDAEAYVNRGSAKMKLERHEAAIEDYSQAIDLDPGNLLGLKNKSEAHILLGEFDKACEDAREAQAHSDSVSDQAVSVLLELIAIISLEEDIGTLQEEYREICNETFTTTWSFEELDSWIEDTDLDEEKEERIRELINILREHTADSED